MTLLQRWHTGTIHRHTLIVSLVPALLIATLLTTYFTYSRFQDLQQGLLTTGQLLANQIAPAAAYGVESGNFAYLQTLVSAASSTQYVRCINVYNQDNQKIASITKSCPDYKQSFKFDAPIYQHSTEPDTHEAATPPIPKQKKLLGRVVVVMTDVQLRKEQQQSLLQASLLNGFAFMLTLLLAHALSRSLSLPLKRMSYSLKAMQQGNYSPVKVTRYTGEIGELANNINRLAADLSQAKKDQQIQLLQATKALEEAEHANRSKSDFLAMMSHELRTPMNGILGMLQLLETTEQSSEQKEYTQFATTSGQQLLQVINNILDFSRLEHHAIGLEYLSFNLKELFDQAFKPFELEAKQRKLDFSVTYSPLVRDSFLLGDPTRIKQVLVNLVSNAFKFTEYGFIKVSCQAFMKNQHSLDLAIKVTDSGIGIAKSRIKYMFDAFSQADSSISRRYGGTGLGLSISHSLAVQMGGTLTCSSQEQVGTLFMLKIPLQIDQAKTQE
ncbi:HAMP domain-containing histidine kinase [Thiopseudomonas alkaliphila]|uniref:HAMP domain-containing histidine kinase n=1 Tax=Thiopseudomonas alkaliphila TaxID=1697053 RepID=UPI00069F3EBD|nr:HAMP domain-containing histidine kinase [Thiopseudomonas alkaliphila]